MKNFENRLRIDKSIADNTRDVFWGHRVVTNKRYLYESIVWMMCVGR